ncbi:CLUMA_CG014544, isoform A [Clunio marinus]|uniref:CLUMA_CG014544, isoform A n=1 Tax=Clunio marinus TaxID=568069 RepID=A0A1J1IRU2_9DIPT|nr:CLUMA_CG014544, isoform A [Clunio marinus]
MTTEIDFLRQNNFKIIWNENCYIVSFHTKQYLKERLMKLSCHEEYLVLQVIITSLIAKLTDTRNFISIEEEKVSTIKETLRLLLMPFSFLLDKFIVYHCNGIAMKKFTRQQVSIRKKNPFLRSQTPTSRKKAAKHKQKITPKWGVSKQ